MSDLRDSMERELKNRVIPVLRERGFKGSFPHFRRPTTGGIDLLTFQFDRDGGGFVIEISNCSSGGVTTHWGKSIDASKVTAWDLHPDLRHRLKPCEGSGTDAWFRYDNGDVMTPGKQVLECLSVAESWWASRAEV
jgi:hypothetical protein